MKYPLLPILCATILSSTLFGQEAVFAPNENLTIEGIPAIPSSLPEEVRKYSEYRTASFLGWHPVRKEILLSTRFSETNQIHDVKDPLGMRRQLTFFEDRVAGASYQPTEGNFILLSKDVGGGEWYQLFRLDKESGNITMLTDGASRNIGAVWDRSGQNVAYSSTRRNKKDVDLYVMDPRDKTTDRLLAKFEGGGHGAVDWSPDGKMIAVMEYMSINESNIWLVDATSGSKSLVTPKNETQTFYGSAKFSPDARGIFVSSDKAGEFRNLAYIDLQTKKEEVLTADIPWDVEDFEISRNGKLIAFLVNENGVSKLHLMDLNSKKEIPAPSIPNGSISGLGWHNNNIDLGFTLNSSRSPSDVYSVDVKTGKLTRWTQSETGGLDISKLSEAKVVKWKSFDGLEISGLLYAPPARFKGKRPVIINIHGGPEAQTRDGFLGNANYYLNELGIALILPNVRGSSGYGKTFLKADNGMLRHHSYEDINALFDWIKSNDTLDHERILVTGGSYGGHMTLAIATHYPDKIRAALPIVAMSSLVSFLENTESYRRDLRRVEYGDERDPQMHAYMIKHAPMTLANKISKPLFIVHGKNDPRVPVSEAHQMAKVARDNKVPVWTLVANDEGHGFSKKKNRDFLFYATIQFLKSYLLNESS